MAKTLLAMQLLAAFEAAEQAPDLIFPVAGSHNLREVNNIELGANQELKLCNAIVRGTITLNSDIASVEVSTKRWGVSVTGDVAIGSIRDLGKDIDDGVSSALSELKVLGQKAKLIIKGVAGVASAIQASINVDGANKLVRVDEDVEGDIVIKGDKSTKVMVKGNVQGERSVEPMDESAEDGNEIIVYVDTEEDFDQQKEDHVRETLPPTTTTTTSVAAYQSDTERVRPYVIVNGQLIGSSDQQEQDKKELEELEIRVNNVIQGTKNDLQRIKKSFSWLTSADTDCPEGHIVIIDHGEKTLSTYIFRVLISLFNLWVNTFTWLLSLMYRDYNR